MIRLKKRPPHFEEVEVPNSWDHDVELVLQERRGGRRWRSHFDREKEAELRTEGGGGDGGSNYRMVEGGRESMVVCCLLNNEYVVVRATPMVSA